MKKTLCMILALVLMLSTAAFAVDTENYEQIGQQVAANDVELNRDFISHATIQEKNGALLLSRDTVISSNQKSSTCKNETVLIVPASNSSVSELRSKILSSTLTGSQEASGWDSTYGIKATLTIFYKRTENNGVSMAKVTSCSGTIDRQDRSLSVTKQLVSVGSTGLAEGGFKTQAVSFEKTSYSWTYTTPSTWVLVNTDLSTSAIGANCTYTVKRLGGNSTWTFDVDNNL